MHQRLVETGKEHANFTQFTVCMTIQIKRMLNQKQLTNDQAN
jgi:hypothetical protein